MKAEAEIRGRSDDKYFTIVFEGDVRNFPTNPFKMETAFGRVAVVSLGNLADECDVLEEENDELTSRIQRMEG